MISLANSIHTNVDQSATLVQPKERIDIDAKVGLASSSEGKGQSKDQQSSDSGSSSYSSGNQQKDVEFKKSSGDVVHLYSKKSSTESAGSAGKSLEDTEESSSHSPVILGAKNPESSNSSEKTGNEEIQKAQESKLVAELKKRDTEVRQHELAHAAVGGAHAGAPQYKFTKGPDGKNYAVEGEVSVNASFSGNAEEKLEKARTIRAAALAPAEPSSQDRQVAAQAARVAMQAQTELVKLKAQEKAGDQSLDDQSNSSVSDDKKVSSSEKQSESPSQENQPAILGSDQLDKDSVEKNRLKDLLSSESESAEKESIKENSEKDEAHTSASTAKSEASASSASKTEKSQASTDESADDRESSESQESTQSVSSSGSSVDEVSVFFETQSKMLASYDQVLQSGEYINENNGGLFKHAELNVLA
jgi:SprA-related family